MNEEIKIPKFTPTESAYSAVCKKCGGRGTVLYTPDAKDFEWLYGTSGIVPQDYIKDCPKCKGKRIEPDTSGTPDMYKSVDITKFKFDVYKKDMTNLNKIANDFVNNFERWFNNGKGLYLWSKTPGSGKTFLACCIGKSASIKAAYNKKIGTVRLKFITAPDYIDKVSEKISIQKNGGFDDPSRIYRECELLILDDIGAQIGRDWQQQEIFKLVNERNTNGLVTIYTSNMHIEDLNIDERAKSRIMKQTICLQMPEESIRQKIAESEQNDFLRGVL